MPAMVNKVTGVQTTVPYPDAMGTINIIHKAVTAMFSIDVKKSFHVEDELISVLNSIRKSSIEVNSSDVSHWILKL